MVFTWRHQKNSDTVPATRCFLSSPKALENNSNLLGTCETPLPHNASPRSGALAQISRWGKVTGFLLPSQIRTYFVHTSLWCLHYFGTTSTLLHSCRLFLEDHRLTMRDLGVMHPRPRMDTADYDGDGIRAFRAVNYINEARDSQPRKWS